MTSLLLTFFNNKPFIGQSTGLPDPSSNPRKPAETEIPSSGQTRDEGSAVLD